jgi:5'-nucleotidase
VDDESRPGVLERVVRHYPPPHFHPTHSFSRGHPLTNPSATLATTLTTTLLSTSTPYLPSSVYLNVNFPSASGRCTSASSFKYVLSRVNAASGSAAADVSTCGATRLPTESKVVGTSGCYVSVSVGNAATKGDSTAANQAVVLGKLKSILSCLP